MRVRVDNQETLNVLGAVCSAACKTGELPIAKSAVVLLETTTIEPPEEPKEEPKKEEKPKK